MKWYADIGFFNMMSEFSYINKRIKLSKHSKNTINKKKILCRQDIIELKNFNETIKRIHENHSLKQKEMIAEFKNRFTQKELEREQKMLSEVDERLSLLNSVLDEYFAKIEVHVDHILIKVLDKLCINLSDEKKAESVISMVVRDYREEISVILKYPSGVDLSYLDIPKTWKVINDDNLNITQCKLELKFGEVLADFEFAVKEIVK